MKFRFENEAQIREEMSDVSEELRASIVDQLHHAMIYTMQRQKDDMPRMITLLMAASQLQMLLNDGQHELFGLFTREEQDMVTMMHPGQFVPIRQDGQLADILIEHLKIDQANTAWEDMPPLVKKLKRLNQLQSVILWDLAMVARAFHEGNQYSTGGRMELTPAIDDSSALTYLAKYIPLNSNK